MALSVKPLENIDGYLRWKESMLLHLHTVGVAHVLVEDPPACNKGAHAARKWARDDGVCRGHILAALSDDLFPDYVHHTTGREVWQAVERTYDLDTSHDFGREFKEFRFRRSIPLLEQIAHVEALAARMESPIRGDALVSALWSKFPSLVTSNLMIETHDEDQDMTMSMVRSIARGMDENRVEPKDGELDCFDPIFPVW